MKDTYFLSQKFIVKKWFIIDVANKILGQIATKIAKILLSKNKLTYTSFLNSGDIIIIINASKIMVSGKKEYQKNYTNHSGQPGGLRVETLTKLRYRKPKKIIEHAIKGMLPKRSLGRKLFTNLKIYNNNKHPHQAQKPELLFFDI